MFQKLSTPAIGELSAYSESICALPFEFRGLLWRTKTRPEKTVVPLVLFALFARAEHRARAGSLGVGDYVQEPASALDFLQASAASGKPHSQSEKLFDSRGGCRFRVNSQNRLSARPAQHQP